MEEILSYWVINRTCNYSCPYCITTKITHNPPVSEEETIAKVIAAYNYLETIKPVNLVITGGEPTLMDLPAILSKLSMANPIKIYTNLSETVEYYKKLNKVHAISILCSYHPTEANLEEFITKANTLAEEEISVLIKVMVVNPNTYKQASLISSLVSPLVELEFHTHFKEKLKNRNFFNKVVELPAKKNYLLGDKEVSLLELKAADEFSVNGWECTAQGNALCIDFFGRVFPCKTYFQNAKPCLFTVFDGFKEQYAKLSSTIKCPFKECMADFEILKWEGARP